MNDKPFPACANIPQPTCPHCMRPEAEINPSCLLHGIPNLNQAPPQPVPDPSIPIIAHVRWVDSGQSSGWTSTGDVSTQSFEVYSVGIVVALEDGSLTLSTCIAKSGGEHEQFDSPITIPICAIFHAQFFRMGEVLQTERDGAHPDVISAFDACRSQLTENAAESHRSLRFELDAVRHEKKILLSFARRISNLLRGCDPVVEENHLEALGEETIQLIGSLARVPLNVAEMALRAICITRDYCYSMLPALPGWEWYDVGKELADEFPDALWAGQFRDRVRRYPQFDPTNPHCVERAKGSILSGAKGQLEGLLGEKWEFTRGGIAPKLSVRGNILVKDPLSTDQGPVGEKGVEGEPGVPAWLAMTGLGPVLIPQSATQVNESRMGGKSVASNLPPFRDPMADSFLLKKGGYQPPESPPAPSVGSTVVSCSEKPTALSGAKTSLSGAINCSYPEYYAGIERGDYVGRSPANQDYDIWADHNGSRFYARRVGK